MAVQARCLVNPGCSLGEGPTWDPDSQRLYWVDILENRIYRYDPADESTSSWTTPEHVGFVVVRPDGGLIAGLKSGLHHVALNDDASVTASRIDRVDRSRDDVRFNDATSDAEGRIWACTLGGTPEEPLGTYYCYDTDLSRRTVDDRLSRRQRARAQPGPPPPLHGRDRRPSRPTPGRLRLADHAEGNARGATAADRLACVRLLSRRRRHRRRRKPLAGRVSRQRRPLLQPGG